MDNILPQLLSFPPHPPPITPLSDAEYDKQIRGVIQLLNETPAKKLTTGVSGGGDLLDVSHYDKKLTSWLCVVKLLIPIQILNPSVNTLPYLYVLLAHVHGSSSGKVALGSANKALLPGGRLWEPILTFLDNFDPIQIRYCGQELRNLLGAIEKAARQAQLPAIAIQTIRTAILRLDPSSSCFTSTHLSFLRLCLEARDFEGAKPVLENDIFSFPASSDKIAHNALHPYPCSHHDSSSTFITQSSGLTDKITYKDHLQYFLLGGMIYTGLQQWERALHSTKSQ